MAYISNTDKERKEMFDVIGVKSFDELISNIPQQYRLTEYLSLDNPLSELELSAKIFTMLSKNKCLNQVNSFLGGGVYDHFIPAAVDSIISRPEFLTAYTPYQAEVSQGTLQWIYEYQTLICELTGMEISNAGMYDGASAAAEAILMACRKNRLTKALVSETVNPWYIQVMKAYTEGVGIEIQIIPAKDGVTDLEKLDSMHDDKTCCVIVQTPNCFGYIEDCFETEGIIRKHPKALFIPIVDPISLAILNSPAEYNADIVVGEGQALGNKPYYGGPLFGFLATKMDLSRNMPGRIVGATTDVDGKKAYSLTLQAREQHIRRDKATSNICSNEALCSLAACVYMCMMGKSGMKEVAELSMAKAHYLAQEICKIDGFSMAFHKPFFKEFAIRTQMSPDIIIEQLVRKDIFPGINISCSTNTQYGSMILIAVTEKKSKEDMDKLVNALREVK
jgi:glycine dehydrogenase subunit 1